MYIGGKWYGAPQSPEMSAASNFRAIWVESMRHAAQTSSICDFQILFCHLVDGVVPQLGTCQVKRPQRNDAPFYD